MFNLQKHLEKKLRADDVVNFLVFYDKHLETLLTDCTSVGQVFRKMAKFVSFFDFDLLDSLIKELGSDTIKRKFEEYKESFESFSRRRVYECPNNAFGSVEESEKVFVLKTDKIIEDLTVDEIKRLKYRVNKILANKLIQFLHVEEGCVKLTFRTFQEDGFTITEEQRKALCEVGITQITYGDQCVDLLNFDYEKTRKGMKPSLPPHPP